MYMNPFLTTKPNYAPTYIVAPPPQKKSISILPIEEEKPVSNEIAKSALKLETARKISVTGDATGAAVFDGAQDAEIRLIVKNADRATKDGNGKEISKIYAAKTDLLELAKKSEVTEKINYLESILYATKNSVNAFQNELNAAKERLSNLESLLNSTIVRLNSLETTLDNTRQTLSEVQGDLNDVINDGSTSIGGENVTFAGDDDINNLFGD